MKNFLLLLVLMVSGCVIGNGRICGPQTPIAYCDKEADDRLLRGPSDSQQWIKDGMTKESRQADWEACGGWKNGSYGTSLPSRTMEESKMANADSSRKFKEISACMTSKGYYHVYEFECDARCLHR